MIPTWGQQFGLDALISSADLSLADLTHSAIAYKGAVTPSMTRSTTATCVDSWGRQVTCLAGELRFPGARRVRNLVPASEDLNNASWLTTQTVKTSATQISDNNVSATHFFGAALMTVGRKYAVQFRASLAAGTKTIWFGSTGTDIAEFNLSTGATQATSGTSGLIATQVSAGVWDCSGIITAATGTTLAIGFANGFGNYTYANGGSTNTFNITRIQLEDITGQSVQTAGEYVSVGVESAPAYHGSMVDGVKCFPTDLSGNPLTGMTTPLLELAATQLIAATADIRDMTTASWTLGATMTRARTSVGWDGGSNLATRLTGGAVAATNTITYTLVAAASSRTYSVGIKRITGTGPVRLTQDNFATSTDISSQLTTTGYTLVQLNQSQLNAVFGIKIDTNGDAIDVDMNQFEAGAFATSRILTGGATRNADQFYYTDALLANIKTLVTRGFKREVGVTTAGAICYLSDGTTNNTAQMYLNTATQHGMAGVTGGVVQWGGNSSNAYTPGTLGSCALSVDTNDAKSAFNGVAQTPDASVTRPVVTRLEIGMAAGALQLNGYPGKIYGWTRNLSQSEVNGVSA